MVAPETIKLALSFIYSQKVRLYPHSLIDSTIFLLRKLLEPAVEVLVPFFTFLCVELALKSGYRDNFKTQYIRCFPEKIMVFEIVASSKLN